VLADDIGRAVENALGPPATLARYSGKVELRLARQDTPPEESVGRPRFRFGEHCRLLVGFLPASAPPRDGTTDIVVEGEERPQVVFDLRPEAHDIRFVPERASVSVTPNEASLECEFRFVIPAVNDQHQIWLEIAQARRLQRVIEVELDACPP